MSNEAPHNLFAIAADLVNYTDKDVFLTGKAGTGKTTFLKYIREHTHKNAAVVAPTGVAAINAGGTTLHSLLHLPFGVFIPEGERPFHLETREEIHDRQSLVRRTRFAGNKRKVIEALELLIIDEISMVRADLLDMVDTMLRFVRRRPMVPFGGVQVLYIGDMFQLPPVLRDNDREILKDYYKSPFFFDARVIQEAPPVYVELTHVYRQTDADFIKVLNQVRNNNLTPDGFEMLRERYIPGFRAPKAENYITLTTHNVIADKINAAELDVLPARVFEFRAEIKGDFPEFSYPVDQVLRLKPGAQVMFLKNDLETPRRYFNGKIGVVCDIDTDYIKVMCPGDGEPIRVPRETWRNIRYTYESSTRAVKEDELGTFVQYPLRLAWAITIHKSQGLTFEKAIIDVERAFEAGQVYVALSRCTTLAGMVLSSNIRANAVMTNERIAMFGRKERSLDDLLEKTNTAKGEYIRARLREVFNFSDLVTRVIKLQQLYRGFSDIFNASAGAWLETLHQKVTQVQEQARPLLPEVSRLLQNAGTNPGQYEPLQLFLRQQAPVLYSLIQETIWPHWRKTPGVQTGETRKSAEAFFDLVEVINDYLKERISRLERLSEGFSVEHFFGRKGYVTGTAVTESFVQAPEKKEAKKPTAVVSAELFLKGKSPEDIAKERGFMVRTIEGHLAEAVEMGLIPVDLLLDAEKLEQIEAVLPPEITGVLLAPVKEMLGEGFSYAEIKYAVGYRKFQKQQGVSVA